MGYEKCNRWVSIFEALWSEYWKYWLLKMNEVVRDQIRHQKEAGKSWSDRMFSNIDFSKFIVCIMSAVSYGKKLYRLWGVPLHKIA